MVKASDLYMSVYAGGRFFILKELIMKTEKKVVAHRRQCKKSKGSGLSHYVMMDKPVKKEKETKK